MNSLIQKLSTVKNFTVQTYEIIDDDVLEALYDSLIRLGTYHGFS